MLLQCNKYTFIYNRATLITIVKSKMNEMESFYRQASSKVKEIVDEFY